MDFADSAQDMSEIFLKQSLNQRHTITLPFSGSCISCGHPVIERRFCDSSCRSTHEKTLKMRMIDPSY